MLQITEIIESPLENKKYRAYTNDGKHYDFGLKGSKTYLDHHNKFLREKYRVRHLANEKEYYLIDNAIMSPALLIRGVIIKKLKIIFNNLIID